MMERCQEAVVEFLRDGAGAGIPATVIETHISRVFLLPDRVFKLKRAVKLPYADFSTFPSRLAACEREVVLNRRTAPSLYRGVRRITREADGRLALDGAGEAVDAVVEMARFDQEGLFDRLALDGRLDAAIITKLARAIARFHREAETLSMSDGAGVMRTVIASNEASFKASSFFPPPDLRPLFEAFREALRRLAGTLDRRAREGRIRRCHGDLHLRNICLIDGEPVLFDCIEFNEQFAVIDVLYDLSFLLMDLWHRGERALANLVLNRYLDETGDEEGFVLLPFFMAVRAAVRAHVLATQAESAEGDAAEGSAGEARAYFDLAGELLRQREPGLIALSGFSGSGKTTVAEALAPFVGAPPGARILESDRIRKGLFGAPAEARLPPEAYRPEVSQRVYGEMMRRIGLILRARGAVVANAVFDRSQDRELIEREAHEAGVPFRGFQLVVPAAGLRDRVARRTGSASDATVEVLERQLRNAAVHDWWRPVDAGRPVADIVADILKASGRENVLSVRDG